MLLGMHPDQCTEDILDVALEHNISVAIVPCCVFPDLFSTRRMSITQISSVNADSGNNCIQKDTNIVPVRTYDDFLRYLMSKDDGLQMATLPFEGKNKVIYKKVSS